jgi:hypothetical protein
MMCEELLLAIAFATTFLSACALDHAYPRSPSIASQVSHLNIYKTLKPIIVSYEPQLRPDRFLQLVSEARLFWVVGANLTNNFILTEHRLRGFMRSKEALWNLFNVFISFSILFWCDCIASSKAASCAGLQQCNALPHPVAHLVLISHFKRKPLQGHLHDGLRGANSVFTPGAWLDTAYSDTSISLIPSE